MELQIQRMQKSFEDGLQGDTTEEDAYNENKLY